jgi:hypothetical protein
MFCLLVAQQNPMGGSLDKNSKMIEKLIELIEY